MQDNLPKDPFADHAWEEMLKLLDREMPERKRRVPLLWWWILLPLAGLGYWAWTELHTPETKPQVLTRPDVPVAVQETPQPAPSAVAAQPAMVPSEGSTDLPASVKNGIPTQAKTQRLIQTNTAQVNFTEVNKPVPVQKSEANVPLQLAEVDQLAQTLPVTNPNVEEETAMPPNPTHIKLPNESTTHANASNEEIKEPIPSIANVATRQADFEHQMRLPALNLPLQEMATNEVIPAKNNKLGLWADAGMGTVANVGDLTYRLGGSVLLQKGRFGLRSGLAYERNQGELLSSNAVDQSSKTSDPIFTNRENNNTQSGSPSTVNNAGFQPVNLSLPEMGFSSFSMPLVLQWLPFKKLGIESGVSLQYLRGLRLNEDFLQSSTGTVYVSNSADLISTVQLSGAKGQAIDATVQNQFAWGVQGALLYEVEKRWQLSLGYRRNLSSFLNTPIFTLQPQWMEIGLRFKVK